MLNGEGQPPHQQRVKKMNKIPYECWVVFDDPNKIIGGYTGKKKTSDGVLAHVEMIEKSAYDEERLRASVWETKCVSLQNRVDELEEQRRDSALEAKFNDRD